MDGWMDGWTDGWTVGRTDGRNTEVHVCTKPLPSTSRSPNLLSQGCVGIVAYLLKARIMVSQQPAVTRQRPVSNRGMVLSAQSMLMAAQAITEYVIPSLSNNYTAKEERGFLRGPCRDVTSRTG
jgi:hypothetical protein